VNPEKMIDDPDDEKPANWVDVAKIEDPAAKKPGLGFRV
jgi:calnexin